MKIYILPVDKKFQQEPFRKAFPPHSFGYMMETDFYDWLLKQKDLLTDNPNEADWHYLPIFWVFWHLSHNYGTTGLDELQKEVNRVVKCSGGTFTVCQFDGGSRVNIGHTIIFLGAKTGEYGIPIPILTLPHELPEVIPEKKYLGSFRGKLRTHEWRQKMVDALKDNKDFNIVDTGNGEKEFVSSILESYSTICPRGSAAGSFRFYESMQLGVVPIMTSNMDVRPFKKYIDWNSCSFFVKYPCYITKIYKHTSKERLIEMGENAKRIWQKQLYNQNWCKYVLKELEDIKSKASKEVKEYAKLNSFNTKGVHKEFDNQLKRINAKVGAEIGVWYGNHAEELLKLTGGMLYGIDPYSEYNETSIKNIPQYKWNLIYASVISRLYYYQYAHIRESSSIGIEMLPGDLDYVFIDGDHDYSAVLNDIKSVYPKVRTGGIIGGDDYGHPSLKGVKSAVDEYFKKVNVGKDGIWWVQK